MIARRSLTLHLMAWALGALLIVWGGFVVLGYRTGIHEADELTDGHLASVAMLQLSEYGSQFAAREPITGTPVFSSLKSHEYQRSMSVVVWDGTGRILMRTGEAPEVPFKQGEGFETLQLGNPATAWRAFSRWDGPRHERKVAVLLDATERDDLAQDIAEQLAEPGFWLLPVVALVLGLAIHRGLRPLYELSRDVDALDIAKMSPLRNRYEQKEFRAVVESINTLAGRYHAVLARERELSNELAHELRTPLASITLQARALRLVEQGPEREVLLQQLERDALRSGHVLSDLLALARASRTDMADARQALDLDEIARQEVASFGQTAHQSGHELALVSPGAFELMGHPVLLGLVIRNLVENALSHTPVGTQVEVQLDPQQRWLQVCDTAIHPTPTPLQPMPVGARLREAAADASLGLGWGLGHRVVEKIAQIHGARFEKIAAPPGFTSCFRLSFAPRSALKRYA